MAAIAGTQTMALSSTVGNCAGAAVVVGTASNSVIPSSR